ncbi:MAG: hypothetical protein ACR2NN_17410 [Bryobacteraceae bacterium]
MTTQEMAPVPSDAATAVYPAPGLAPRRPVRVALVGPDGVGKSTTIAALKEWFREELPNVSFVTRQWRPSLLPDLGAYLGKPSAAGRKTPPRREAGRFHAIRVFYYFLDFLIGSWWKDKLRSPASSLILYDRCALDMFVDPVRFGLRSRRGTWLLWKLTPRPDLIILLHDHPDRIWQRKQELQRHEMAEQLNIWLQLVERGEVDNIIQVDAEPGEIASRIRNLILDAIGRRSVTANHEHPNRSLEWLGGILAGHSRGSALSAEPVPGAVEAARFAVLPSTRHPRFLVPLEGHGHAARSLEIYNAQTFRARAGKLALELGLRAGMAQPFLRSRCSLWMAGGIPLHEYLREAIGCGELTCAISMGTPNRSQKPVLQLMDERGRIVGYAKAGWNERTIGLVQTEARTLERLAGTRFSSAAIPRALHAGFWNGIYLLVQSGVDGRLGPSPAYLDARHLQFLIELYRSEIMHLRLPWSHFSGAVSEKLEQLAQGGFHYSAHLFKTAVHTCRRTLGDSLVPAGYGHGDFTPWNIWIAKDRLLVVDWEYGGPGRPPLWDLFHFHIGSAIELRNCSASEIYRQLAGPGPVRDQVREYCLALAIPESWTESLLIAYLCEALSGKLLLDGPLAGRKEQRVRATIGGLLGILCRPGAHA